MRVCPGRYRIADPTERGVIIAAASGTRIDLTGVVLESGDSVPARFTGIGVASKDVDRVSVLGGTIRGYRIGLRLEGGAGHEVSGTDLSGSRAAPLRSATRPDTADRLDPFRLAPFTGEGGAGAGANDRRQRHGGDRERGPERHRPDRRPGSYLADNVIRGNTGWGISLWRSSQNVVIRNQLQRTVRCAPRRWTATPPRSCCGRGATRTRSPRTTSAARARGSGSPVRRRSRRPRSAIWSCGTTPRGAAWPSPPATPGT